jgi:hypothetical protein
MLANNIVITDYMQMSFIEVGESYLPRDDERTVESICWLAREILGGYMLDPCDIDMPKLDGPLPGGDMPPDPDRPDVASHELILLETHQLQINDSQNASLSNRPYLSTDGGVLLPWTQPDYVALHLEPFDMPAYSTEPDPVDCDQVIFRLPQPGGDDAEAAIFHGFKMDEEHRIYSLEEVERLEDFLLDFTEGLRRHMTEEGYLHGTYLSGTPEPHMEREMMSEPWRDKDK